MDLDPVIGSESDKRRPAVLVSNDGANLTAARLGRGVVTVVPITSSIERVYRPVPGQIGRGRDGARPGLESAGRASPFGLGAARGVEARHGSRAPAG